MVVSTELEIEKLQKLIDSQYLTIQAVCQRADRAEKALMAIKKILDDCRPKTQ